MRQAPWGKCLWLPFVALHLALLGGCRTNEWIANRFESRPRPATQQPLSNVVVVHSSLGYWPGCNDFVADLHEQGVATTMIRGWDVNYAAQQITTARRSGSQTGPLVLVGYSRGANSALKLTRRLQNEGITVDKLVLLEAAVHDSIPANVMSCLNVYRSTIADEWEPLRAQAVTVESAETQLVNYNIRFHDAAPDSSLLTHFTLCRNEAVMGLVAEHVTSTLRTGRPRSEWMYDEGIEVASSRGTYRGRFVPSE